MKSDARLEFATAELAESYARNVLFRVLNERKEWLRDCDFFTRKNRLYVCTGGHLTIKLALAIGAGEDYKITWRK